MKNEILNSLDVIQETCNETEVAVAEAIVQECYKAMDILGYSDTDVDQFNIIQEGKIMDDVKKQGEGQSKVMRILSFIPRLIAALFKAITGKLQTAAKSAKNVIENTKGKDKGKMETFINGLKKGDKKAVKTALIGLGVAGGVAGGVGAGIVIKKKSVPNTLIGAIKEGLSKENGKSFEEFYKSLHEIMTDEEIEEFIDFLGRIDYDKLSKKYPKKVLDEIREYKNELEELLANRKNFEKASTSDDVKKETPKTEEKPSTDEKKESKPAKNEPEKHALPNEMDKAVDEIMKQYSDLQNSGDVKLIDFYYGMLSGLSIKYNSSTTWLCGEISIIGYDIMAHPDKLDKFKSFYNSYSETVKKFANSRYKTMTAAIAACVTNNIGTGLINKDQMFTVDSTKDLSVKLTKHNDYDINDFNRRYGDTKKDSNFNNNSEAIKALETIADIIKQVYSEILTYISTIVDIVTKLEAIFGYEEMGSHTNEKS